VFFHRLGKHVERDEQLGGRIPVSIWHTGIRLRGWSF
jgi:hypothetical protein